jgi:hypothetical protein
MKLKERTWPDKNTGEPRYAYAIKTLNKFGEGIVADTVYSIELAFDAQVRRNQWTDTRANPPQQKVIVSVQATGKLSPEAENTKYNSYGNASFELPEGLVKDVGLAKKGDTIYFALKSFEGVNPQTQKKELRTKWVGSVNKPLDLTAKATTTTYIPTVISQPVFPSSGIVNDFTTLPDVTAHIKFCVDNAESFKKFDLQGYVRWAKDSKASGITTKLDDGQIVAMYGQIQEMLK